MASNYDPSLNLAAILQNLSSHAQQAQQPPLQSVSASGYQSLPVPVHHQHYPPVAHQPQYYQHDQSISATLHGVSNAQSDILIQQNKSQERLQPRVESPAIQTDPRSLIEWSKGLRFVTKLASHNPSFASRIQKVAKLLLLGNG